MHAKKTKEGGTMPWGENRRCIKDTSPNGAVPPALSSFVAPRPPPPAAAMRLSFIQFIRQCRPRVRHVLATRTTSPTAAQAPTSIIETRTFYPNPLAASLAVSADSLAAMRGGPRTVTVDFRRAGHHRRPILPGRSRSCWAISARRGVVWRLRLHRNQCEAQTDTEALC